MRATQNPRTQHGIALAIALILLILVTLIGLAALRGTTTQQKMTSNFYDREIAFQNAEAGLVSGAAVLLTGSGIRNCVGTANPCLANPFLDANATAFIQTAPTSGAGSYTAPGNAQGQPQFVIEDMGNWIDPNAANGFTQSANAMQYGAQGVSTTAKYYRITARSADPSQVTDRAIVTLQAMYKQ
ncbi:pilus assembly PilX family protein [Solimonas soli]|uniref:pilus assembly PilX family protein n=1 Tax=Solimonas soli TaxID=413479 RepID=UPI001B7FE793|nr:PilX N-terminal domain-containing pilus assembly protein [Solimonas soli]